MWDRRLFNKGFPTNRIPVELPSTGQTILLRETTIVELKSICKTVIDNLQRKHMHIIYDAITDYLRAMILTDGVDVDSFTEFDRLFCLMVFFQLSFYKDPIESKCPHCGVQINYRYDMSKYINQMQEAFIPDQTLEIPFKGRTYTLVLGWPSVRTMSLLNHNFYSTEEEVTDEMERTQYGINFVLSFIKRISVRNSIVDEVVADVDLLELDSFKERLDCINELPSMVVFDEESGVFSQTMGMFVNRLENCFGPELCPQCHKETDLGISHSSVFMSLLYGSFNSIYGFILKVECLLAWRFDSCIFGQEQHLTYNDLMTLVQQLSATTEKDNKERQQMSKDNLGKGLWLIREILNLYVFPEDRKHSH